MNNSMTIDNHEIKENTSLFLSFFYFLIFITQLIQQTVAKVNKQVKQFLLYYNFFGDNNHICSIHTHEKILL